MISNNFSRAEFACGDECGYDTIDAELINVLEDIRQHFESPITITSGARCEAHNAAVGGGKNSQHKLGRAADIQVQGVNPLAVQDYIDSTWPDRYGMGRYSDFTHIDTRSGKARW